MLETLFGIKSKGGCISASTGILGHLAAYYGVVKAQGRGTLHLHMLLWLQHAPICDEMHTLLQSSDFRECVHTFIKTNIRAHLDGFTEETICSMSRDSQLAYSQPPDPRNEFTWVCDNATLE